MGPGGFFPTNPDLADILGRTDFDFENFYFLDFLGPKFLAWAHPRGPHVGPVHQGSSEELQALQAPTQYSREPGYEAGKM